MGEIGEGCFSYTEKKLVMVRFLVSTRPWCQGLGAFLPYPSKQLFCSPPRFCCLYRRALKCDEFKALECLDRRACYGEGNCNNYDEVLCTHEFMDACAESDKQSAVDHHAKSATQLEKRIVIRQYILKRIRTFGLVDGIMSDAKPKPAPNKKGQESSLDHTRGH